MATIQQSLRLYDGMTGPLKSINQVLHSVVDSFEAMQSASGRMVDTSSLQAARQGLQRIDAEFQRMEESAEGVRHEQDRLNRSIDDGASAAGRLGSTLKTAAAAFFSIQTVKVVAGLAKQATELYADYEQLTGGIQTLFEDLSWDVQQNAANAFRTAGLSTNEYMETALGFAASLNASLTRTEGNIRHAADYTDMAIIDMSDNANKLGSTMESIQNAYQGFAKGEFRMLDNLSLGYSGSAEEMERLLSDAERIKAAQGEVVDYSKENFSDIIQAIHVIQTEMGVTGTTALEAAETVSGSLGMLKASWTNLLTGLGDPSADLDQLMQNFADSLVTAAENLIPVVARVIWNMVQAVFRALPDAIVELVIPAVLGVGTAFAAMSVAAGGGILAVIRLVVLLIGFIYSYAASVARSTGVAKTGFGVIAGAVNVVIQFVWNLAKLLATAVVASFVTVKTVGSNAILAIGNLIQGLWNTIKAIATNIATAFENGFHRAKSAVYSFVSAAASKLLGLANLINSVLSIFDVQINTSGLESIVNSTAAAASAENSSIKSYEDVANAFKQGMSTYQYASVGNAVNNAVTWSAFQDGWKDNAFQTGAAWGDNLMNGVSNALSGSSAAASGAAGGSAAGMGTALDPTSAAGKALNGISDGVDSIAGNTADLRDSVGTSAEELKLLREMAEKQAINQFTTAEIRVEMTNNNQINSEQDLDGIVRYLEETLEEAMYAAAEGVHV